MCDCWCVYVSVPLLACVMCEHVQVDVNDIDFVCYCMFCCIQRCMCVILHKHHFSTSVHKHSTTCEYEKCCNVTAYARAMHMDARVCFVLDPLSSSVNLTLAKRQLPLQFSRSLILMAGPL